MRLPLPAESNKGESRRLLALTSEGPRETVCKTDGSSAQRVSYLRWYSWATELGRLNTASCRLGHLLLKLRMQRVFARTWCGRAERHLLLTLGQHFAGSEEAVESDDEHNRATQVALADEKPGER